jgi:hypothetical protein
MIKLKRCRTCCQEYASTSEYFPPDKSTRDGLLVYCRICVRAMHHLRRQHPGENIAALLRAQHRIDSERERELFGGNRPGYKVCKRCNVEKPATSEHFSPNRKSRDRVGYYCKPCKAQLKREYDQKYPDRKRASNKRYESENPEKAKSWKRNYKKRHPDRIKEQGKRYNEKNIERVREIKRRNMRKPVARIKQIISNEKHRARKKGLPCNFTTQNWSNAKEFFSYSCVYCGISPDNLVREHYIPLSSSTCPGTIPTNILPACLSCNSSKGNRDAYEWMVKRFGREYADERIEIIRKYFQSVAMTSE